MYDTWAEPAEIMGEYGIQIVKGNTQVNLNKYSPNILAVAHQEFKSWNFEKSDEQVVFDVKSVLDNRLVDAII